MGRGRCQGRDAVQDASYIGGGAGNAEPEGHGAHKTVAPVGAAGHAGAVENRLPDGWGEAVAGRSLDARTNPVYGDLFAMPNGRERKSQKGLSQSPLL
jgi:hypothetical protein